MKRPESWVLGLALAGLVSFGIAGPAAAVDVTLYELTENMSFVRDHGKHLRTATSSLTGFAALNTPLCPADVVTAYGPGASACVVNAVGSDRIDVRTGQGHFEGTVTVVVPGDNAVDGPELVAMSGTFHGKMDFAPALVRGVPYGTVSGSMKLAKRKGRIPFSGVFRLPFAGNYAGPETGGMTLRQLFCPATPAGNPYAAIYEGWDLAYISTSNGVPNGTCVDISPTELSLGSPLVRFEITFGARQRGGDRDDDD